MTYTLHTLVLNLDRRPDRWRVFEKRARQAGVTRWERVAAVDGKQLAKNGLSSKEKELLCEKRSVYTQELPKLNGDRGHGWIAAECACALSHYGMWERVASFRADQVAMILEDDVWFKPKFQERMQFILKDPSWDLLFLGQESFDQLEQDDTKRHPLWMYLAPRYRTKVGGSWAYMLTAKGARKLLAFARKRHIQQPVDWFLLDATHALKVAALKQWIVMSKIRSDSDIQWSKESLAELEENTESLPHT